MVLTIFRLAEGLATDDEVQAFRIHSLTKLK